MQIWISQYLIFYDPAEKENSDHANIDPLWYSKELQKIRVVECWYKEHKTRTMIKTSDGQTIPFSEETKEQIMQLMMSVVQLDYQDVQITQVKLCVFFFTKLCLKKMRHSSYTRCKRRKKYFE